MDDKNRLTEIIALRLTADDAALVREQAKLRDFDSPGAFVRSVLLHSFSLPSETRLLMELALRTEEKVGAYLKALSPEPEDVENLRRIDERLEIDGPNMVQRFIGRRGMLVGSGPQKNER